MDVREKEQKKTVKYKEQEQAIENGSPLFFVLHAGRSGTLDSPFANKADSLAYFHLLGQFSAFKAESPLYFSKNQLLLNLKRRTDSISLKTVYFPHLRRIIRFGAWLLGYCYSQKFVISGVLVASRSSSRVIMAEKNGARWLRRWNGGCRFRAWGIFHSKRSPDRRDSILEPSKR